MKQPFVASGLILAILAAGVASADSARRGVPADVIYVNGTIVTMDVDNRLAEAVAVVNGQIAAVGSNAAIGGLAGDKTKIVDLHGKTMTPGFYAAHDHFPGAGTLELYEAKLFPPPIGDVTSMSRLVELLKQKADETPEGNWIVGRGYDQTALEEGGQPTRYDLDKVSTRHPIMISAMYGHIGTANSNALQLAGVTKDTPDPADGIIRRDPETGEPNGVLEEGAKSLVQRKIPPYGMQQTMDAIAWASEHYASKGVTTIVKASGGKEDLAELQQARAKGLLPLRLVFMGRRSLEALSPGEASGLISGFGDSTLKLGAIKIGHDGSNQGYTGYQSEPYYKLQEDVRDLGSDYRGYPRQSREELVGMVKGLHRAGYQIGIHGNGDAAIEDIIHAYREAQKYFSRDDTRHRIEHAQTSREDQLDAMRELGITPSFYVGHVYYWGDGYRDVFLGPDRARRISPLKSAMDRGIRFTLHDDTPVTPVNPLQLVWVAVNRLTSSGKVLGPEQRIPVAQALRAITIDAAWQNFEEKIKGSIEMGKLADFVVLSDNPLTVSPAAIRNIQVLETIVGGETVFRSIGL